MTAAEIEAIERATVAAVAPRRLVEAAGWLVPLDEGAISRAKSAAPLSHKVAPDSIAVVEAAFADVVLRPAFRIADVEALTPLCDALAARGYAGARPTITMVADPAAVAAFHADPAALSERPGAAWAEVFSGPGFDAAEGASRAAAHARAPDALFGQVEAGGRTCAVGVIAFAQGFGVVSGLRTDAAQRGRGHASRILAAFARAALDRGVTRLMLQVEAPNPARALYARAGFADLWTYRYWTKA